MTGSPERATRRLTASMGLAPCASLSLTTRPVSSSAQVEALTNRLSEWPRWRSQRPPEIFSAISSSAVSLSGILSSASAMHIRMTPSSLESPYSRMKASTPACLPLLARAAWTRRRAMSAARRRSSSENTARSIRRSSSRVSSMQMVSGDLIARRQRRRPHLDLFARLCHLQCDHAAPKAPTPSDSIWAHSSKSGNPRASTAHPPSTPAGNGDP